MNPYLAWVKSNIPIVILAVVMIAAAIVLPILSSGMNASLREEVKKRAGNDTALSRIETVKHTIETPGQEPITSTGPANPKTITLLEEYEKRLSSDVDAVRDLILTLNRQGREVLVPALFPNAPSDWRDSLQFQFWRALRGPEGKYEFLLSDIKAGIPPSQEELQAELRRADEIFRTQKLAKAANDVLTADEQEELRVKLREERMREYTERAQELSMYASPESIDAPYWDEKGMLALRQLFDWEWQLWIKQDILGALHKANKSYPTLLHAPVKRVRWLAVTPLPAPTNTGNMGSSTPSPFGGGSPPPPAAAPPGAAGTPINPKVEAPRDYSLSFTGRVSNALYDVRHVRLQIVVDTARIPEVLNALAAQNLMTVLDLKMNPTDAYKDLEQGFVYGSNTTSDLELTIETIWLREWTAPLMPQEVKDVLNPPVG